MTTKEPVSSSPEPGPEGGVVSNPFDSDPVAHRYARGRLYYHRSALSLAAQQLSISHVHLAVDVACGTGLSTQAVIELADNVVAVDVSAAMMRLAPTHPRVRHLVAAAERIPLRDASADLATVGAAFHWFDQSRAYSELARVLSSGAGLIVYTDFFHGRLVGQPAFATWLEGSYLRRYPMPARRAYFDPDAALAVGFADVSYFEGGIFIPLTQTQLADYLLSQSNAVIVIESGAIGAGTIRAQILSETARFFRGKACVDAAFGIRGWTTVRA